jgi:hypothetical protein
MFIILDPEFKENSKAFLYRQAEIKSFTGTYNCEPGYILETF